METWIWIRGTATRRTNHDADAGGEIHDKLRGFDGDINGGIFEIFKFKCVHKALVMYFFLFIHRRAGSTSFRLLIVLDKLGGSNTSPVFILSVKARMKKKHLGYLPAARWPRVVGV